MGERPRVGPYLVEAELGRGAMGVVYRAIHAELGREVALKVLPPPSGEDAETLVARFRREMQVAAAVQHENIVRVFDGGHDGRVLYLAMELVDGASLDAKLEDRPMAPAEALELVAKICDGLAALHERGIVHRDVKPGNVLVAANGGVKVADFGLARDGDRNTMLTTPGIRLGTPRYWPPEVLEPDAVQTAAGDVWAAGAMLFRMLTGRRLREEESLKELALAARRAAPDVRTFAPEVGEGAAGLCARMLALEPERRPSAAAAAREARAERDAPARPARPPSKPRTGSGKVVHRTTHAATPRARVGLAAGAALGLLVAGIFGWSVTRGRAVQMRPAIPSPSVASASRVEPPRPAARRAFRGWRGVAAFADRLRAGGKTERRAVGELRAQTSIPLGSGGDAWWMWIRAGAWLEAGAAGDPPVFRKPRDEADGDLLHAAGYANLRGAQSMSALGALAAAIGCVSRAPSRGEGWVALGWALERDGDPELAERAYRFGLARTLKQGPFNEPPVAWLGLARALAKYHPDPARTWWAQVERSDRGSAADMLAAALDADHPDLEERVLLAGVEIPARARQALALHACFLARVRRDPDAARHRWEEAIRRFPADGDLASYYGVWLLGRGLEDAARPYLARAGADPWATTTARAMLDPAEGLAAENWRYGNALARAIERLALEVSAGAAYALWKRAHVEDAASLGAGELSGVNGSKIMEELLRTAESLWTPRPLHALARAVWLSRLGRHQESLEALARARELAAAHLTELPVYAVTEVVTAPLLATPAAPDVARRAALADPGPRGDAPCESFVQAVRAGDTKTARAVAARLFEAEPGGFWGLARYRLAQGDANDRAVWRRRVMLGGPAWARRVVR